MWFISHIGTSWLSVLTFVKPKGGPLEIEIFLLRGVNEKDWRGVRRLPKPSSAFLINKKLELKNVSTDNQEVPPYISHNNRLYQLWIIKPHLLDFFAEKKIGGKT